MAVSDARDVISLIRSFRPDVILLDILMPKIDGVKVCKTLNSDFEGSKTPIIVISALDTHADKLMLYKLGVVDFLTKPVEAADIIARIDKALFYK